jgi:hypothetical protein
MPHKTESHCIPNLIAADVSNNKLQARDTESKNSDIQDERVKSGDLVHITAEYIGTWEGLFTVSL